MELDKNRLTPKEKANELKNKVMQSQGSGKFYPTDRQSALLTVDEILDNLTSVLLLDEMHSEIIYWNEVRSELMNINETLTKIT